MSEAEQPIRECTSATLPPSSTGRSRAATPFKVISFLAGDPIAAAHLVFFVGMVSYDPYDQIIPPVHEMVTRQPVWLVAISYCAYQVARLIANSWRQQDAPRCAPPPPRLALCIVAVLTAAVVLATQLWNLSQRGSLLDVASAKADSSTELGPLNRITFIVLPVVAGVLFYTSQFHRRYRPFSYVIAFVCALSLALTLFKMNVIFFIVLLLWLSHAAKGRGAISLGALLRSPVVAIMVAVAAVAVFYMSEGEDVASSVAYVTARATQFSWEGFAYIVETEARPDLGDQWQTFLGHASGPSPDLVLASEMLGLDPPPFGTVVTLPGFTYRNFGTLGVAAGSLLLGVLAQLAAMRVRATQDPARLVFWLVLYQCLIEVFLVGNVFNTVRGAIATLVAVYASYRAWERIAPTSAESSSIGNRLV